jgi:hypothetical protein
MITVLASWPNSIAEIAEAVATPDSPISSDGDLWRRQHDGGGDVRAAANGKDLRRRSYLRMVAAGCRFVGKPRRVVSMRCCQWGALAAVVLLIVCTANTVCF